MLFRSLALILVPIVVGVVLLGLRGDRPRTVVVTGATLAVAIGTVMLVILPTPDFAAAGLNAPWANTAILVVEMAMALYVINVGIRARSPLVVALMVVQAAIVLWLDLSASSHPSVTGNLFVDQFSVIMAVINGIVGGGICIYALGYMRGYHKDSHPEVADRRPFFFSLLFMFMGANLGLILAKNIKCVFLFWDV